MDKDAEVPDSLVPKKIPWNLAAFRIHGSSFVHNDTKLKLLLYAEKHEGNGKRYAPIYTSGERPAFYFILAWCSLCTYLAYGCSFFFKLLASNYID